MLQPISPKVLLSKKCIDVRLIKLVNELLDRRFDGRAATINLDELPEFTDDPWHSELQNVYRGAGWKIEVERPSYGSHAKEALVFSVKHLH